MNGCRNINTVNPQGQTDLHLEHLHKVPFFHVEELGLNCHGPLTACGANRCCFDDEKRSILEGQGRFMNYLVVVHKSPNPAKGAVLRFQWAVNLPSTELCKLLHSPLVEKQGTVRFDLQCSGKFECKTLQEDTKEKDRFPW